MHDDEMRMFSLACTKPRMYVQSARYDAVCAFIDGYNMALCGGPLVGFREWLLIRIDEWANLPWWALVRRSVIPESDLSQPCNSADDSILLVGLHECLTAFAEARTAGGIERVFFDYANWLLSRGDSQTERLRERLSKSPNQDG